LVINYLNAASAGEAEAAPCATRVATKLKKEEAMRHFLVGLSFDSESERKGAQTAT
jgi:hypothetical protein